MHPASPIDCWAGVTARGVRTIWTGGASNNVSCTSPGGPTRTAATRAAATGQEAAPGPGADQVHPARIGERGRAVAAVGVAVEVLRITRADQRIGRHAWCDNEPVNGATETSGNANSLRELLYGLVPLDDWANQGVGNLDEPWQSFERARTLIHAGNIDQAVKIWCKIALTEGLSSRHALQAWLFMRQAGAQPPAAVAKATIGAAVEVPMHGAHDLLVAYQDGTADYVNYSGRATTWRDRSDSQMRSAIEYWHSAAQTMADTIGPWGESSLPPLPTGHSRVIALTASGPHFGQGPEDALSADPTACSFLSAATRVMLLMTSSTAV